MDTTVPVSAARLLDFIRDTEVGTDDRGGYDVIYGFNQSKLPKPVTAMTVDEVLAAQAGWSKRFGSSATGGYQFMRATLAGLKTELGLRGVQLLDADLQDRLGYHLLKRRGYEAYAAGTIGAAEFGKRVAMEWASFPVLAATKGAHLQLSRGQSYYAGDKLNKALVTPARVEAVLAEVLSLARAPNAAPIAVCKPEDDQEDAAVSEPQVIYIERPAVVEQPVAPVAPAAPAQAAAPTGSTTSKAQGGAIGTALVGSVLVLFSKFGWIPQEVARDPETVIILTTVIGAGAAWIGAYLAPRNAVPVK
jgi:muramidase (phage lysozyme)